jgi:hypothetical protein
MVARDVTAKVTTLRHVPHFDAACTEHAGYRLTCTPVPG